MVKDRNNFMGNWYNTLMNDYYNATYVCLLWQVFMMLAILLHAGQN